MKTYAYPVLALALLSACSRREAAAPAANSTPASATQTASAPAAATSTAATGAAPAASYPITGEIISIDVPKKNVVMKHDEIKGYMPAMTMEFIVSAGDAAVLKPGQRVRAEMIPSKDGDFRLEKIWPADAADAAVVAAGARALREDTHNRGKNAYREVGEVVPDFALYDQEARVVKGGRFRGKQVMMNFIFSRCPVATMCPAATTKMTQVQRLAREAGVPNLELVSISLEPSYDTPGVLKAYAADRGIDTSNFSFLTGPDVAIKDLLTQFGVIAEFEGDFLKHTLTTLLIDENGKIAHRTDGSAWEPKEFIAKMRR